MYFNLIGCDGSLFHTLRVYQKSKFNTMAVGRSYKFGEVVQKPDGKFWVVASSMIALTAKVEVPEEILDNIPPLPEELPPTGIKRKLTDASTSDERSTVTGKIIQVVQNNMYMIHM